MFEAPKIMGLKNIIRIKIIARSFLCPENPGAVKETIVGVKIIKTTQITIKNPKKTLKSVEKYFHASSLDLIKYPLNIGITAADMAPNIKIKAIKSGTVKAE